MHLPLLRAGFLTCAATIFVAAPAHATSALLANAQVERDYLPGDIIVTGQRDNGYGEDDGSSGTKTPTALIDLPQTVAFVTDDQLEDQAIRQLGEALRYVPGVSMESGEGHRDEVFIRGQESTADFYLDGLRDDAQYYRSLYNVERIEVLKGANALIFGRGGGGGVVNRVTKKPGFSSDAANFNASIDSHGAYSLSGDLNAVVSDAAALRLNAAYEHFDSNRDFFDGRFVGFVPSLALALGEQTKLTFSYSYDDDKRLVDRGVPAQGNGPLRNFDDVQFGDRDFNRARAKVHIAKARLDHEFSTSLSANATVQFADYDKFYANLTPRGLVNGDSEVEFSGYRDALERQNWIGQANLVWLVETGALSHMVLAGIEASAQDTSNNRRNAQFADGTGGFASRFTAPLATRFQFPAISLSARVRDRQSDLGVLSAYLQDQLSIGEHLEIIAGLRWDRFDLETTDLLTLVTARRVDEKVSPRLGAIYKPSETISIYASYAESFLPQSGEQFFVLSTTDARLAPEKFTNYELGIKWAPGPGLFATAAIFQLDRTKIKAPDPANSGLTILAGESRTKGIEFSLAGSLSKYWQINLGYTYLDGKIRSTTTSAPAETRLEQVPEHQLTLWTRHDLTKDFGIGLGAIYQDDQFASLSNAVALPDYLRVDAALYYTPSERLSFQLNVENLFDADYFPSAHGDNNIQPGKPLTVRFGARLTV